MPSISKAVVFAVNIANDNLHGYDQTHRNGPNYDCSSLVATALNEGGFNVARDSWTGNLLPQLEKCGFVQCKPPWKKGDIHLNVRNHVCMSVSADRIVQASINEKGTITGGKSGDQTGKEIWVTKYYEYSKGWDYHLRYTGEDTQTDKTVSEIAKEVIAGKWGNGEDRKNKLINAGYDYGAVQAAVNDLMSNPKIPYGEIARQVIAGKWGNGKDRVTRLTNAGYNASIVQNIVNDMLK